MYIQYACLLFCIDKAPIVFIMFYIIITVVCITQFVNAAGINIYNSIPFPR